MKPFKFLKSEQQPTYQWIGGDQRTIIYDLNGTVITILNEELFFGTNRIECQPFINIFRWSRNFNHRQTLGDNFRTNTEVYEGTIGRFYDTYDSRRLVNRHAILPEVPVIERIDYSGSSFYADTLKFSRNDMWVRITYKKFYERV